MITKRGCHICESVISELETLAMRYNFELETKDILEDGALFDKYWIKIPVIRLDGRDVLEVEEIAMPEARRVKLERLLSAISKKKKNKNHQ